MYQVTSHSSQKALSGKYNASPSFHSFLPSPYLACCAILPMSLKIRDLNSADNWSYSLQQTVSNLRFSGIFNSAKVNVRKSVHSLRFHLIIIFLRNPSPPSPDYLVHSAHSPGPSQCLYDADVRRVCKTPGVPCGCTRQHSQRSGLPLPSPWIKHWPVFSS